MIEKLESQIGKIERNEKLKRVGTMVITREIIKLMFFRKEEGPTIMRKHRKRSKRR